MSAIPFFVMAGSIMNFSGISTKLMQMADVLTGHLTGGMAKGDDIVIELSEARKKAREERIAKNRSASCPKAA